MTLRNSSEHSPTAFGYSPALDGLRAFAVLSVVLFHAGVGGLNGGFLGRRRVLRALRLPHHVAAARRARAPRPHQAQPVLGAARAPADAGAARHAARHGDRRSLPARQRRPQAAARRRPGRDRVRRQLADDLARHRVRRRHRHPVATAAHLVAGHRGTVLRAVAADHRGTAGVAGGPPYPLGVAGRVRRRHGRLGLAGRRALLPPTRSAATTTAPTPGPRPC